MKVSCPLSLEHLPGAALTQDPSLTVRFNEDGVVEWRGQREGQRKPRALTALGTTIFQQDILSRIGTQQF